MEHLRAGATNTFLQVGCVNLARLSSDILEKEQQMELRQIKFREELQFSTPLKTTIEAVKELPTPFRDTLNAITGKETPMPQSEPAQLEAKTGKTVADRYREAMERHHEREHRPTREYNFNKEP